LVGRNVVGLWQRASAQMQTLDTRATPSRSVAFSPDGRFIAFGALTIHDRETGLLQRHAVEVPPGHAGLDSVAFTSDGVTLAACAAGRIDVWNFPSLERRASWHEPHARTLAFSPDGSTFLSGGGYCVHLWDASTGRDIASYDFGTVCACVAFAPDGMTA